jgi:3-hydroxyisobutyrate dehydrogenase-like beta-hydroxyacid dehydrogenase
VTGPDGILTAVPLPAHVVDLSTSSPEIVGRVHARCATAGVGFVDAPVSGGRMKAETGELSVLAGGDDGDVAAVRPLLDHLAAQVFHVGPCGAGTVAKLVNNQLFLGASVLVQEAFVLAAAAGLEPAALAPILKANSAGTYAVLAPLLLGRAFDDVVFRLDIAAKDLALAVQTAADHAVDVPATAAALATYRAAIEAGLGARAFHATLRVIEDAAGIELPALTRPSRPG